MVSEKKEYCGLFGIFGDSDAVQKTYFGLFSLQHRGQESAGIASSDGESIQLALISHQLDRFRSFQHLHRQGTGNPSPRPIPGGDDQLAGGNRGEISLQVVGPLGVVEDEQPVAVCAEPVLDRLDLDSLIRFLWFG